MSVVVKDKGASFIPAPEGLHKFVCVDVIDMGEVQTSFGKKQKIRLVLQIDKTNPETGKRHEVHQWYNASLNEKATLSKHLESWRGKKFSKEERAGFDVERVIGHCGQVHITHSITDSGTYANIAAIVPLAEGQEKLTPLDYIRVKDRTPEEQKAAVEVDDDIPF